MDVFLMSQRYSQAAGSQDNLFYMELQFRLEGVEREGERSPSSQLSRKGIDV